MFLTHLHYEESVFIFNPNGLPAELFKDCHVAMVQRLSSQENYKAIQLFKQLKMKIIYDLDDDLWSVPIYNPAYKLMKTWLPGFEICANLSDAITVSTAHLKVMVARTLGKKAPPIYVVENAIDTRLYRPLAQSLRKNKKGKVIVGWAGTNTHSGDVKKVFAIIPQLLDELPEMEFELVGEKMPEDWQRFGNRVRQRDFVPVSEFPVSWASWQWDLSLAPLESNAFNLSKSNLKALEAAAVKIPCVMSDIGEYGKFCSESPLLRKNVLADKPNSWKQKITSLVKDAELRRQVGEEMYRVAVEKYEIKGRMKQWTEIFREVAA
jgi:glycosyltransferase involved in cell wall biosynthesis